MNGHQLLNPLSEHDFYKLVSDQKGRLFGIAFTYLKNEADALEAVQEATCRAYMKRRSLKDPARFNSWLIRILINYCMDEQKRRRRMLPVHTIPETSHVSAGLDVSSLLDLEQAVGKLKAPYRHVVILKFMQDMTLAEIAEVMDRPESTIKTWLYKALKQLRRMWGEEGGMDRA